MIIGFQCPYVFACNGSNVFIRHAVVVAHVEGDALLDGQGEQSLLESHLNLTAVYRILRLQLIGQHRTHGINALEQSGLPAQMAERFAGGDAIYPDNQPVGNSQRADGRQDADAGTAWDKALTKSIETRKRKAQDNENNIAFAKWLNVYESKHGKIDRHTDLDPLVYEANALGYTTSTGMRFNKQSLRQMIYRTHERNVQI